MKFLKTLMVVALPLVLAAGCENMQGNDKAMADKSAMEQNQKMQMMEDQAKQAAASAQQAADAAKQAAASAEAAAREAKMAGDKVDRIYSRGLRKR